MKVTRNAVFETNSSSTHSITIGSSGVLDKLPVDEDGVCRLHCGEFGWEQEEYGDAATKASYCATYVKNNREDDSNSEDDIDRLFAVIMDGTGATGVEIVPGFVERGGLPACDWGRIDHQSSDVAAKAFQSDESLKSFIFDKTSILRTDNDNH